MPYYIVEWLGHWTCDQQVTGSNRGLPAVECNPEQVVNTDVPLSPSSIIWYQPMVSDALRMGRLPVGLVSQWPGITDISGSPPMGLRPWS